MGRKGPGVGCPHVRPADFCPFYIPDRTQLLKTFPPQTASNREKSQAATRICGTPDKAVIIIIPSNEEIKEKEKSRTAAVQASEAKVGDAFKAAQGLPDGSTAL